MITTNDIQSLVNAASNAGYHVNINDLQLLTWNPGKETHSPLALPTGFSAIYIFKYNNHYLKVGKVNTHSNARYQSQHYNPDSSISNLSKSIMNDSEMNAIRGNKHPGVWLKENTFRFNVLIPNRLGKNFVHFAEVFFVLKCNPRFEGRRT